MAQQITRRLTSAAFGLALVGASGVAFGAAAQADSQDNITFCHATGDAGTFVVLTTDGASIVKGAHGTHQDGRDVIPPFEYVAQGSEDTVSFEGLNWDDNWETDGAGVATEDVAAADCAPAGEPTPTVTPTPTPSVTPTPTPSVTVTPTPTPSVTVTPTPGVTTTPSVTVTPTLGVTTTPGPSTSPGQPNGPVIETDLVDPAGTSLGFVLGGTALLLAGGATLAASRRRGSHS
ncbi:hypothetical protein [Knoellia aerolata]|uniref:Gram-positive cocci surface proteins LPxTG domain-containing protein n=1 Tax=Knoellia aerolata DSM 18566 TaxID=1385519 RepID=A0A0A0K0D3_9MICO|nr:hypothetical protein [Knoellia aerolata]KGN42893.1 hypothetical protein N801_11605 [Knoellia aerolata DSM 18566]